MSLFNACLTYLVVALLFVMVYLGGKYYARSLRENLFYPKTDKANAKKTFHEGEGA